MPHRIKRRRVMTKSNGQSKAKRAEIPSFLKIQLEEAQKRLTGLEEEAQKVLQQLRDRGQRSREEMEQLFARLGTVELDSAVKAIGKKANVAGTEVRKRLEGLQTRVVEATGVASQSQLKAISRELARLSKKVDALTGRKGKAEVRA
jgi:hypothetical protein